MSGDVDGGEPFFSIGAGLRRMYLIICGSGTTQTPGGAPCTTTTRAR